MTINTERLETDAAYWDSVAPRHAKFYIVETGIFVEETYRRDSAGYIPRPTKPAAPEWDGEGYPPVGREVECWDGEEWILGQSVGPYLGGWLCMLSTMERPFVGAEGDFRPLRTKEQRDRDELAKAVESGMTKCGFVPSSTDCQIVAVEILSRYNLEPKP